MIKAIIIDDDASICELVKINLELSGFTCLSATDPNIGFALVKQELPDVVILDVMMGEVDGYSVALKIRQNATTQNIPIIMLTALGELKDKLKGFDSGVDDYLTKPFEIEELKARVRVLAQRTNKNTYSSLIVKEVLNIGDITLMPEKYEVKILDKTAKLTPIEFEILNILVQNYDKIVPLSTMLKEIWGYSEDDNVDIIRVHMRHLRSKIDKISCSEKKYIKTVYGGGYRLSPTGSDN
ncbi:MAG: response regulator transcription factor [Cyanobacteria bacterium SIG30]|nr:response regulator transcription factor [Cyanobacteria bacterium SIG30]